MGADAPVPQAVQGKDVDDEQLDKMIWRTDLEGNPIEGRAHAPPMPDWYRRRLENRAQMKARAEHKELEAKKAALECPPELLLDFSPQELDEIRDLFMEVDTDESGEIDENELAAALQGLDEEITRARLRELMLAVDEDGSGTIDFGEFLGVRWPAVWWARKEEPLACDVVVIHVLGAACLSDDSGIAQRRQQVQGIPGPAQELLRDTRHGVGRAVQATWDPGVLPREKHPKGNQHPPHDLRVGSEAGRRLGGIREGEAQAGMCGFARGCGVAHVLCARHHVVYAVGHSRTKRDCSRVWASALEMRAPRLPHSLCESSRNTYLVSSAFVRCGKPLGLCGRVFFPFVVVVA